MSMVVSLATSEVDDKDVETPCVTDRWINVLVSSMELHPLHRAEYAFEHKTLIEPALNSQLTRSYSPAMMFPSD
jgi:hypothetical protein